MHAALSSRRECLQVLFLVVFSRHVHSITVRLQRAGCDLLDVCQADVPYNEGKVVAPSCRCIPGNQTQYGQVEI